MSFVTMPKRNQGSTTFAGIIDLGTTAGITASTTQTQGQGALTSSVNEISVCATTNDVVTLPAAVAGRMITIINNGAEILQVYPASGDTIDEGAADASKTQAAGANFIYIAQNGTNWNRINASL